MTLQEAEPQAEPQPPALDDELAAVEAQRARLYNEFYAFIGDEIVVDRWSSERLIERDTIISAITAASQRRWQIKKDLGHLGSSLHK